jgi:hypothetical protein
MNKGAQFRIGYLADTKQATLNAGINAFALDLIAEAFGDKWEENFPEGGVLFSWPLDHAKRAVWIAVSHAPPHIIAFEHWPPDTDPREAVKTPAEHQRRHIQLHAAFDELFADFIKNNPDLPTYVGATIGDLMSWSSTQIASPTELPDPEE